MLAKPHRLPEGQKLENAQSLSVEYFKILIKPNDSACNRFGFVVSKKVDKRAVVRNRLKRVLREAVKEFLVSEKGQDVLFVVKKSFVDVSSEQIFEIVRALLKKVL